MGENGGRIERRINMLAVDPIGGGAAKKKSYIKMQVQ